MFWFLTLPPSFTWRHLLSLQVPSEHTKVRIATDKYCRAFPPWHTMTMSQDQWCRSHWSSAAPTCFVWKDVANLHQFVAGKLDVTTIFSRRLRHPIRLWRPWDSGHLGIEQHFGSQPPSFPAPVPILATSLYFWCKLEILRHRGRYISSRNAPHKAAEDPKSQKKGWFPHTNRKNGNTSRTELVNCYP